MTKNELGIVIYIRDAATDSIGVNAPEPDPGGCCEGSARRGCRPELPRHRGGHGSYPRLLTAAPHSRAPRSTTTQAGL